MSTEWDDQEAVVHRLPRARLVDRTEFLCGRARDRRVIHIGFADVGFHDANLAADEWLHAKLGREAKELIGLDIDPAAVDAARERGWEAYAVDCTDAGAVAALDLEPAELVVAGEVIEHLANPGDLLEAIHPLVAPDGRLVVTTPNAAGWLNPMASLAGFEVNHPDHLVMFTWHPLTALMDRCGWRVVETATYCPSVKELRGPGLKLRLLAWGARLAVWLQRTVARTVAPFVADGLVVEAAARRDGADPR